MNERRNSFCFLFAAVARAGSCFYACLFAFRGFCYAPCTPAVFQRRNSLGLFRTTVSCTSSCFLAGFFAGRILCDCPVAITMPLCSYIPRVSRSTAGTFCRFCALCRAGGCLSLRICAPVVAKLVLHNRCSHRSVCPFCSLNAVGSTGRRCTALFKNIVVDLDIDLRHLFGITAVTKKDQLIISGFIVFCSLGFTSENVYRAALIFQIVPVQRFYLSASFARSFTLFIQTNPWVICRRVVCIYLNLFTVCVFGLVCKNLGIRYSDRSSFQRLIVSIVSKKYNF